MTAASYTWPRGSVLLNGNFETTSGTTTVFANWTQVGAATANTTAPIAGSIDCFLGQNGEVYQTVEFVESGKGRWIDQTDPLLLSFFVENNGGVDVDGLRVQVFLLNSSDVLRYSYDFVEAKWVASPSTDMDDGKSYWYDIPSTLTTAEQRRLPRIEAPLGAGQDVNDNYKLRVRIVNEASVSASCQIDTVSLSPWAGAPKV
jgi:hypothetical protein